MFGICILRNLQNHIQIGADVIYDFERKANILSLIAFPFPVKRHIPKICCRLHFQSFGTFADTFPLGLAENDQLSFCSFQKYLSLIFLSNIGVLGAAAPNKPTAEPVGKKMYFFCTCDNQPSPFFNRTKTNRLMLSRQEISDFLAYARIGGFLQNGKQSIELFIHIGNSKGLIRKLGNAFFHFGYLVILFGGFGFFG